MNPLLLSLCCASGFALWPIFINSAGLSSSWSAIMVAGVSFLASIIFIFAFPNLGTQALTTQQTILGLFAGSINGLAFVAYAVMVQRSGCQAGKYVAIVAAMIPVIAMVGGFFILKDGISLKKFVGLVITVIGIFILNSK